MIVHGECEPLPRGLFFHFVDQSQQAFENFKRRRRASADVQIDGNDILDGSCTGIAAGENAAIGGAIPQRHHPFRLRRRGIGALQRLAHVPGHRAGDQQHIGMAGRGHEFQAETLDVVDRIVDGVDLQLAAIAGSGIDLADGQGPAEPRRAPAGQALGEFGERRARRAAAALWRQNHQ